MAVVQHALLVERSLTLRNRLAVELRRQTGRRIKAIDANPHQAWACIQEELPAFLVLDVSMLEKFGLMFLRMLMIRAPLPVIVLAPQTPPSSLSEEELLRSGAAAVVQRPDETNVHAIGICCHRIQNTIQKSVSGSSLHRPTVRSEIPLRKHVAHKPVDVIAIGASAGGPETLRILLAALPHNLPPIVIVQHMPVKFTAPFAERLNQTSALTITESQDELPLLPGHALIAEGDHQLRIRRTARGFSAVMQKGELVSGHRPSVDVLFHSVAEVCGNRAIGVILTGMGQDGAAGLLTMRNAGACTIAQNEETCAVFGMPKEAIALNAAEEILPLCQISERLIELAST